jgi:hypothetical protein
MSDEQVVETSGEESAEPEKTAPSTNEEQEKTFYDKKESEKTEEVVEEAQDSPAVKEPEETPPAKEVKKEEEVKEEVKKVELKFPEGSLLTKEEFDVIVKEAKDKGFTDEQSQELVNRLDSDRKAFLDRKSKELKDQSVAWVEELRNDKEVGGDHFNKNVELAKRYVNRFFPDDVKKALDETGLGNHPGLVRGFVRAAKAMSEDELIISKYSPSKKPKTAEDVLYGSQGKKH